MKELLKDKRIDPYVPDKNGEIVAEMITDPEFLEIINRSNKSLNIYLDAFKIFKKTYILLNPWIIENFNI